MIAAISMMRRRADIDLAQFGRHWLDPHGVMTAELPGVPIRFKLRKGENPFAPERR